MIADIAISFSFVLFIFILVLKTLMRIRWLVRAFDSIETTKEGWVPASILDADSAQQLTDKAIYGDRADDAAYRRQYVQFAFFLFICARSS